MDMGSQGLNARLIWVYDDDLRQMVVSVWKCCIAGVVKRNWYSACILYFEIIRRQSKE